MVLVLLFDGFTNADDVLDLYDTGCYATAVTLASSGDSVLLCGICWDSALLIIAACFGWLL